MSTSGQHGLATGDQQLRTTHDQHWKGPGHSDNGEVFTVPYNPSIDGNTVEIGLKQAVGQASVEYQATLDFLQGRVTAYKRALKRLIYVDGKIFGVAGSAMATQLVR